ncbi:hypothetical protein QL285_074505 [Trifolium repens]|nr:hypothetical protein QL285_074505 [Trifolium repens]
MGSKRSHNQKRLAASSWKAMKEALEEGIPEGWGKLPNILEKKDRFGVGYQPSTREALKIGQGQTRIYQETFRSGGFRHEGHVALLEDTDGEIPDLVYRFLPDDALNNWEAIEIPKIISIPK